MHETKIRRKSLCLNGLCHIHAARKKFVNMHEACGRERRSQPRAGLQAHKKTTNSVVPCPASLAPCVPVEFPRWQDAMGWLAVSSAHSPRMPKPAHHARLPFDIGGTQFRTSFRKTAKQGRRVIGPPLLPSARPVTPSMSNTQMGPGSFFPAVRFGRIYCCLRAAIPRQFKPLGGSVIARVQEGEFLTVGREHGFADARSKTRSSNSI